MLRGPRGQERQADAIGCAVSVGRIATGEIEVELKEPSGEVRSGKTSAKVRVEKTTKEARKATAKKAAAARWG